MATEVHPGVWERVLHPLAADMEARAHELSVAVHDRIEAQLPALFSDPEGVEANRRSAEASIRAFADVLEHRGDPSATELPIETLAYARDGARQRVPLTALMRSYRLGHAALWTIVARELAARAESREELAEATELCSTWMFAFADRALILADQAYSAERERFVRSAEAARGEVIAAILADRPVDLEVAGSRLRHPLDREHVGVQAWLEEPPADGDVLALLEGAVATIAERAGATSTLVHPDGMLAVAAWISGTRPPDVDAAANGRLDASRYPGVRVALGELDRGVPGFRATHQQAAHARRVASLTGRAPGSVTRYGRVALQAMATLDLDQARAFVARELGALAGPDDTAARLVATLEAYLDEHASRGRTARRLGLHDNTVSYRIRQIEEILERDLESDTLDVRVALTLLPAVRDRR